MGKFFDTLNKLEKVAHQPVAEPAPGGVAQISTESGEKFRSYPKNQPTVRLRPSTDIGATELRLVCLRQPASLEAESFRILRGKLLFTASETPPRVIMVTSAEPQDGKSLVAANLAVSIAQGITSRVVLIDCDLRRPTLHRIFGLDSRQGLREYLETGTSIEPFLLKTQVDKLALFPAGRPVESPSELLASPKMRLMVEEIKGQHAESFLILDTPPAHVFADAAPLCAVADGVVLAIRCGKTPREPIIDMIANVGAEKILGVVFNASEQAERHYKSYYHYYRRERESP
jgi:protein-tyrosine kinase